MDAFAFSFHPAAVAEAEESRQAWTEKEESIKKYVQCRARKTFTGKKKRETKSIVLKTRKKIREQKKIRIFFDKFDNKCCKGYETIFTFAEHEKFFFFSKVFFNTGEKF